MAQPIALQMYTLRREAARDFNGTIQRVAAIGYVGIESGLDLFSENQHERLQLVKDLGLQIPAIHTSLPIDSQKQELLKRVAAEGVKYVVVSWMSDEHFRSEEGIKQLAERLNEANEIIRRYDLTFCYHNHWDEYTPMEDGRSPHAVLRKYLSPTIQFELDVYWAQTGGGDPVAEVIDLKERAPLLHIKDGPTVRGEAMTAVGEGKVDIPGVIQNSTTTAQWLIVELDECATDMLEAVEKSYRYLVGQGFARGNKV